MRGIKIRVTKAQVICVLGSILLFLVLEIVGGEDSLLKDGHMLRRGSHGQGAMEVEVYVNGLVNGEEVPVTISVGERQYSEEEAGELYKRAIPELEKQCLGENDSWQEIRSDLTLVSALDDYGLRVRWESEDPELVDEFGGVHNRQLAKSGAESALMGAESALMGVETALMGAESALMGAETALMGVETALTACLTDGEHEVEHTIKMRVLPPVLSAEEEAVEGFQSLAEACDKNQRTEDHLALPEVYEGRAISYRTQSATDYGIIPVLGILLAVLLKAREEMAVKQQEKFRKQQLLLDYSEVVSKLMVFIGAGMTVRLAWEKITGDYEAGIKAGKRPARYVYEEMCATARQLKSGASESMVYGEFGRRCGLQPYLKLGSLLEQNRKTGMKNLKSTLQVEMMSAFEQRKNLAVKLGEEAGTKLLLPLFLMLGIVMVMVVVPAFLSF